MGREYAARRCEALSGLAGAPLPLVPRHRASDESAITGRSSEDSVTAPEMTHHGSVGVSATEPKRRARASALLPLVSLAACSGLLAPEGSGPGAEAGAEGGPQVDATVLDDGQVEASFDSSDAGPEATPDAAPDSASSDASNDTVLPLDAGFPPPAIAWAQRFGNAFTDVTLQLAVAPQGAVYLVGANNGSNPTPLTLGGVPYACSSVSSIFMTFVVKLESDGTFDWARTYCSTQWPSVRSARIDGSGHLLLAGGLAGTRDFGAGPVTSASMEAAYVASYDADGALLWLRVFDGTVLAEIADVAVGAGGHIFGAGTFRGTIDFGQGNVSSASPADPFVVELDADGSGVTSHVFTGAGTYTLVNALALDPAGNLYVAGDFEGSGLAFGGGPLADTSGNSQAFLVSVTAGGALRFQRTLPTLSQGLALTADANGHVALGGLYVGGPVDLGTGPLPTGLPGGTALLATFDTSGNALWGRGLAELDSSQVNGLTFGAGGDLLVAGSMQAWAGDAGSGADALFLYRLQAASGDTRWTRTFGGPNAEGMTAVACDSAGDTFFAGTFFSPSVAFDGTVLVSAGQQDAFVAKLGP
jgi:hypothetical protein